MDAALARQPLPRCRAGGRSCSRSEHSTAADTGCARSLTWTRRRGRTITSQSASCSQCRRRTRRHLGLHMSLFIRAARRVGFAPPLGCLRRSPIDQRQRLRHAFVQHARNKAPPTTRQSAAHRRGLRSAKRRRPRLDLAPQRVAGEIAWPRVRAASPSKPNALTSAPEQRAVAQQQRGIGVTSTALAQQRSHPAAREADVNPSSTAGARRRPPDQQALPGTPDELQRALQRVHSPLRACREADRVERDFCRSAARACYPSRARTEQLTRQPRACSRARASPGITDPGACRPPTR